MESVPRILDASGRTPVEKACLIGVLSALSTALMALSFPTPFSPHLKYDPGDVAAVFAGLSMGPVAGLLTVIIRCLVSLLTFHSGNLVGVAMNGVAGASFVLAVSLVYHRRPSRTGLITAFVVGSITMVVAMFGFNMLVLPWFLDQSLDKVVPFLLSAVTPFNVVKATLNAVIAHGLYTRLLAAAPPGEKSGHT